MSMTQQENIHVPKVEFLWDLWPINCIILPFEVSVILDAYNPEWWLIGLPIQFIWNGLAFIPSLFVDGLAIIFNSVLFFITFPWHSILFTFMIAVLNPFSYIFGLPALAVGKLAQLSWIIPLILFIVDEVELEE